MSTSNTLATSGVAMTPRQTLVPLASHTYDSQPCSVPPEHRTYSILPDDKRVARKITAYPQNILLANPHIGDLAACPFSKRYPPEADVVGCNVRDDCGTGAVFDVPGGPFYGKG